jgi:hypothetical protein
MRPILRGDLERRIRSFFGLLETDVHDVRHAVGVIGLNDQIVAIAADAAKGMVMNFFARIDAHRDRRTSVELAERRENSIVDHVFNVRPGSHAKACRRSREDVATRRFTELGRDVVHPAPAHRVRSALGEIR